MNDSEQTLKKGLLEGYFEKSSSTEQKGTRQTQKAPGQTLSKASSTEQAERTLEDKKEEDIAIDIRGDDSPIRNEDPMTSPDLGSPQKDWQDISDVFQSSDEDSNGQEDHHDHEHNYDHDHDHDHDHGHDDDHHHHQDEEEEYRSDEDDEEEKVNSKEGEFAYLEHRKDKEDSKEVKDISDRNNVFTSRVNEAAETFIESNMNSPLLLKEDSAYKKSLRQSKAQDHKSDKDREEDRSPSLIARFLAVFSQDNTSQIKVLKPESQKKSSKEVIAEAITKRKIVRYIAYFTYISLFVAIAVLLCKNLTTQDQKPLDGLLNLSFNLDNCSLLISDHNDAYSSSSAYVKYRAPKSLSSSSGTTARIDNTEGRQVIEVLNELDPRYCSVQLFVKPDVQIESMEISCQSCNITHNTSFPLIVNNTLNITGEAVYATFRSVKVGLLNYAAITGYLQLTNITSDSDANKISMKKEGDIIIQSTGDFQINATSDTQAFCLSAPVLKNVSVANCLVSGEDFTRTSRRACRFVYDVCSQDNCTTTSKYSVTSKTGNIYANLISANSVTVSPDLPVAKGQVYDDGISFNPDLNEKISNFNSLFAEDAQYDAFLVLNLGNVESKSSRYSKWVVSSSPSCSLMRPYWLGTFSASVLDERTEHTNGFLLPGICPFIAEYSKSDLLHIQNLLASRISNANTLVTFIADEAGPPPSDSPNPNGVFPSIESGNPFDYWFSLDEAPDGSISLTNNDYKLNKTILIASLVSLAIAGYIAHLLMTLSGMAINIMYVKLVDFTNHLGNYAKLTKQKQQKSEQSRISKQIKPLNLSSYTLTNIIKNAPSPSAFLDYFTLMMYRQFSSSAAQFYHLLFRKADRQSIQDEEFDPERNMINGQKIKLLYEQFCFVKYLTEEKLTDDHNEKILQSYGYRIVTREDLPSEVFTRIQKKKDAVPLVDIRKEDEGINSLELFINLKFDLSKFDEDEVEVKEFKKFYKEFCDLNKLSQVVISPSIMKDKYDVDYKLVPQQFLMRIRPEEQDAPSDLPRNSDHSRLWYKKPFPLLKYGNVSRGEVYVIDVSRLENHFLLIMNKGDKLVPEKLEQATQDLILHPKWWFWDCITVLLHQMLGVILTVPIIGLVILSEAEYEPWSVKNPSKLIRFKDILQDPAMVLDNLLHSFSWNVVFVVIVGILLIFSLLDQLLYHTVMDFPQDKSFKNSQKGAEEGFWKRRSRQFEWLLVFFSFTIYFGYLGLLLTWLLLGALINPTSFLPFASAAATFVTFVVTKYKSFMSLSDQGSEAIFNYLRKMFDDYFNTILDKMVGNIQKTATAFSREKIKATIDSDAFKNVSTKLVETGLIDSETANEYSTMINSLNSKTAVSTVSGVTKNPQVIAKELKDLRAKLEKKAIAKVKNECSKRKIPKKVIDLMIAVITEDSLKTKNLLAKILYTKDVDFQLSEDVKEVILELLFPETIKKDETVDFLMEKMMNILFATKEDIASDHFTPEFIINAFDIFRLLEEGKLHEFIHALKTKVLDSVKENNPEVKKLENYMPAFNIFADLAMDKQEGYTMRKSALKLLKTLDFYIDPQIEDKEGTEKRLSSFINFISMLAMLSGHNVAYDPNNSKKVLDRNERLEIVTSFYNLTKSTDGLENAKKIDKLYPSVISLFLSLMKGDVDNIPNRVLRHIQGTFKTEMKGSNFLSYCLKLSDVVFHASISGKNKGKGQDGFQKCLLNHGFKEKLQNFLKIITCYSFENCEQYLREINITNNSHFSKIAKSMQTNPRELLGLLNLICNKGENININVLIKAILVRKGLKKDKWQIIRSLVDLLLSRDEALLLRARIALKLDSKYERFLLLGKGLLNPQYIPEELFEDLKVDKDLISRKDTVYDSTPENITFWMSQVRKSISRSLKESQKAADNANKESTTVTQQNAPYKVKAEPVKQYLSDWDAISFSKPVITKIINALSNPRNDLQDLLNNEEDSSVNYADLLVTITAVKNLQLVKGNKWTSFSREQESAIRDLANCLNVKADILTHFLRLFVVNDPVLVTESFSCLFAEHRNKLDQIQEALYDSFRQAERIQNQNLFIREELPNSIKVLDDKSKNVVFKLPPTIYKKLLYNNPKIDLSISDFLDIVSLAFNEDEMTHNRKIMIENAYKLCLFAKSLLPLENIKDFLTLNNNIDERIVDLFNILTQPDKSKRLELMTGSFEYLDHPIKVSLALYGLLTRNKFEVKHRYDKQWGKPELEPLYSYLGQVFKVYPETFNLFDVSCKHNISKFLKHMAPIIRRIRGSSVIDMNLMESLFSLAQAEHYSPNYLASQLDVSPDILEFCMHLLRVIKNKELKKEIYSIRRSNAMRKILAKLKIDQEEFFAFLKLIFLKKHNAESIKEILKSLNLYNFNPKGDERKNEIDIDLLRGLKEIQEPVDGDIDASKNKVGLSILKKGTKYLWTNLGLGKYEDYAFIISRLSNGNFLALKEYKDLFPWIFKDENQRDVNTVMAFCGLLNPNIKILPETKKNGAKEDNDEVPYQILPSNNISYASHLAFHSVGLIPDWIQLFLFDKKAFKSIQEEIPDLTIEFILALVLQFIDMPDSLGDVFGLYEWAQMYQDDVKERRPQIGDSPLSEFLGERSKIEAVFERKFAFNYNKVGELANKCGLWKRNFWKKFFENKETYNKRINRSFVYLLTLNPEFKARKQSIGEGLIEHISKNPKEFLEAAAKILYPQKKLSEVLSKLIEESIQRCYQTIQEEFLKKDSSKAGSKPQPNEMTRFPLTDLSILKTIILLRENTQTVMSYDRKLYNLNQLATNIERRMFFIATEWIPKFSFIKLLGVPLGLQISNLAEWYLPASLFWKFTRKNQEQEESKDEEDFSQCVGDLGVIGGSLANYRDVLEELLDAESWDDINALIRVQKLYFIVKQDTEAKQFTPTNSSLSIIKSGKIYMSLEMLIAKDPSLKEKRGKIIDKEDLKRPYMVQYADSYPKAFEQTAEPFIKSRKQTVDEGLTAEEDKERPRVSLEKEGLTDEFLKQRYFERALMDPEMRIILNITQEDNLDFLKEASTFTKGDLAKKRGRIYIALIGLQSIQKKAAKKPDLIKTYLDILSKKVKSDITKLFGLLKFLVTGRSEAKQAGLAALRETCSELDLKDDTLDFLFLGLRANNLEDKVEDIKNALPDIPQKDIEAFMSLQKVYKQEKDDKYKALEKIQDQDQNQVLKEIDEHPLARLIELIDFDKITKNHASEQDLLCYIRLEKGETDPMSQIFTKVIKYLNFSPQVKKQYEDQEALLNANQDLLLVIKGDFITLFDRLMCLGGKLRAKVRQENRPPSLFQKLKTLGNISEPKQQKEITSMENLLNHLRTEKREEKNDAIAHGIKFFKIFLTLAQKNLEASKSRENYSQAIDDIIKCMIESTPLQRNVPLESPKKSSLLFHEEISEEKRKNVSQLYIGALGWDTELILKSFARNETMKMGYLFYSLYGVLNINSLLSSGRLTQEQMRRYLQVLLSVVVSKNKATNPRDMTEDIGTLEGIMQTDLGPNYPQEAEILERRIIQLVSEVQTQSRKKPSSLLYRDTISLSIQDQNSLKTFTDIIVSTFDGTLIVNLLDPKFLQLPHEYENPSELMLTLLGFLRICISSCLNDKAEDQNLQELFKNLIVQIRKLQENGPQKAFWDQKLWQDDNIVKVIQLAILSQQNTSNSSELLKLTKEGLRKIHDDSSGQLPDNISTLIKGYKIKLQDKIQDEEFHHSEQSIHSKEKAKIFFGDVILNLFPDIRGKINAEEVIRIYKFYIILSTDWKDNIGNLPKARLIAKNLLDIMIDANMCDRVLTPALMQTVGGDIEGFRPILQKLMPQLPQAKIDSTINILQETKSLLNSVDFARNATSVVLVDPVSQEKQAIMDSDAWTIMIKKIKDGTASTKDLFKMVDHEGDNSGSISLDEFHTLTRRLGLNLSIHRVTEIFAKVKLGKMQNADDNELNESEFQKAVDYLQEKNRVQALQLLGITPEMLTAFLLKLTLLLLMILAFIFLGIKAFTIGGTFESIISSLLPALGGLTLAKERKEDRDKTSDNSVKNAANTAVEITTTQAL